MTANAVRNANVRIRRALRSVLGEDLAAK